MWWVTQKERKSFIIFEANDKKDYKLLKRLLLMEDDKVRIDTMEPNNVSLVQYQQLVRNSR